MFVREQEGMSLGGFEGDSGKLLPVYYENVGAIRSYRSCLLARSASSQTWRLAHQRGLCSACQKG